MSEQASKEKIDRVIELSSRSEPQSSATHDRLAMLEDCLALIMQDTGQWQSFKAASTKYVNAYTKEIEWHSKIRIVSSIVCIALIAFFCGLLYCALSYREKIFGDDPHHAMTALIVGSIGGSVVLMIALVRGAFATLAQRNADLPVPPHMQEVLEVGKMFNERQ